MPRNKINYAAQAMFVGPSPATGSHYADGQNCYGSGTLVKELYRVQGYSYDFNFDKTPISQFGDLSAIDYESATWPQVSLNFSYILSNFINEKNLGLVISSGSQVSVLSGILTNSTDEKNYFIGIHGIDNSEFHQEKDSEFNNPGYILGFGNGFINNYTFNVGVGQLPTVEVGVEALNLRVYDKETSLYNYLVNGNASNGNFDLINSGRYLTDNDFENWETIFNPTSFVKIVPDPTNVSNTANQDLFLISNPSRNAYFTSSTTGATDWAPGGTNATSGYVFINTGTDQLILRKLGVTTSFYFQLLSNYFTPTLSSGKWYKVVYDLESFPSSSAGSIQIGGSNIQFGALRSGLNTGYLYASGAAGSLLIAINNSLTGDAIFNKIELFEPKNYSVRYYATGNATTSTQSANFLYKSSDADIYSYLNTTGLNKRYIYEFDLKYSGFEKSAYGNATKGMLYFRLGQNFNTNFAGTRFPSFDTSYSGQFNRASLTLSNSQVFDGSVSEFSLYNVRSFTGIDGEVWIDNAVLKQTNMTDIVNANIGNGSFEFESPSYTPSGSSFLTGIFSGISIYQGGLFAPYFIVTGSSNLPSYDAKETFSLRSFSGLIVNKTGTSPGLLTVVFSGLTQANKRYGMDFYYKIIPTGDIPFVLLSVGEITGTFPTGFNQSVGFTNAYKNYTSTSTTSPLTTGEWVKESLNFTPRLDSYVGIRFSTLPAEASNRMSILLDDVNIYSYDDCYPLPTVESVSGGFNLPGDSSTNFSGQSTNSSLTSLSTLRPSDFYLNINYSDLGPVPSDWKLQSCSLNLPIPRENVYDLEQRHPNKRFQYPIQGTLSLNAVLGDFKTGNLINYYLECNKEYNVNFGFMPPCSDNTAIDFDIKKAKLTNFEFTNTIGNSKTATMEFVFPIGGPSQTGVGLFISGINY